MILSLPEVPCSEQLWSNALDVQSAQVKDSRLDLGYTKQTFREHFHLPLAILDSVQWPLELEELTRDLRLGFMA